MDRLLPDGFKYRYARITLAWPTLTRIAHFYVAQPLLSRLTFCANLK